VREIKLIAKKAVKPNRPKKRGIIKSFRGCCNRKTNPKD
jgi:hypothetical protein